jgi:lipid-A-disaccharide synthase
MRGEKGMKKGQSILIVAGETSGEQHAAGLMRQVMALHPGSDIRWFGSGGTQMANLGAELLADVSALAAIGPWAALSHLPAYLRLYQRLLKEAANRKPELAVLVDFPEFNLRLCRGLKKLGVRTCYFVGPQVWAWRRSRVRQIARDVDKMLVIFPFEEEFYAQNGVKASYVGNPTYASLRPLLPRDSPGSRTAGPPLVALLPGSRKSEVERIFPVLLDTAGYLLQQTEAIFAVAKAPAVRREQLECIYKDWTARNGFTLPLQIHEEEAVRLLKKADCAIIKSGTSTLEAMVLEVPFAMVYRMARPSWYFARPFATTDTYCLANLVAGTRIVPEFIQDQATAGNIGGFILRLLEDETEARRIKQLLRQAVSRLGERDAYEEAAKCVSKLMLEGSNLE